jgi:pimeloyl-ACP methyl ester carboxylesterase
MFDSNGVLIHYEATGAGFPIVLLHGWASSYRMDFVDNGWVEALSPIRRVIGVDQRGHGASDKPHDPSAYAHEVMAKDVTALLHHLDIERTDVFGYSMGGQIAGRLLVHAPERLRAVVMGGVGVNWMDPAGDGSAQQYAIVIDALLAAEPNTIENATIRAVRDLYATQGNDLAALAAWLQADHFGATREELADVDVPVLVVNGEGDMEAPQVAAAIPAAQVEVIPGANHITVVPDQRFKDRVLRFLPEIDAA